MINSELLKTADRVKQKYAALYNAGIPLNALILAEYQNETGQTTFKTFKQWKEEGQKVKKGEKGFPVFSKPVKKQDEQGEQESKKKYFHTAYLFHAGQIEQI